MPPEKKAPGWYCVRTAPRHEHIAAAQLAQEGGVEVFLPRLRFRRRTRIGPQWVTEALFPAYLFARFELQTALRRVQHTRGVRGVVHFGAGWPTIPEAVIAELRLVIGEAAVQVVTDAFTPGDSVQVVGGAFRGLEAVVAHYRPAQQRVAVLLEFLGRQTLVELGTEGVVKPGEPRRGLLPLKSAGRVRSESDSAGGVC